MGMSDHNSVFDLIAQTAMTPADFTEVLGIRHAGGDAQSKCTHPRKRRT